MEQIGELIALNAEQVGVSVDQAQRERFELYAKLLLDWNSRVNLTAITEPAAVAVRHFADSLSLLPVLELPQNAKVIDVGTGAGFPGVVLKIMRPDLRLTLLDSLNKRLVFLDALLHSLSLEGELLHLRAEEGGRREEYRNAFDIATARAVAPLPVLCELCLPFVKPGGVFAAMKGPEAGGEVEQAKNALRELKAEITGVHTLSLPDQSVRTIVIIEKRETTPLCYPRTTVKMKKSPL